MVSLTNKEKQKIKQLGIKLGRFPMQKELEKELGKKYSQFVKSYGGYKIASELELPNPRDNCSLHVKKTDKKYIHEVDYKAHLERFKRRLNEPVFLDYIHDMELGQNLHYKRRPSDARIYSLILTLSKLNSLTLQYYKKPIYEVNKEQMHDFFNKLNELYKCPADHKRDILCFWRWRVRKARREGNEIKNVCEDLSQQKPSIGQFVHFTFDELLESCKNNFNEDERALLIFVFDTCVRCPSELKNIRVEDITFEDNEVFVNIPKSKTFQRRFNLLISKEYIIKYLQRNDLERGDTLFPFYSMSQRYQLEINKRLKKAFIDKFGDKTTLGGEKLSKLIMYDLRHNGAVFLRNAGVPLDKILYRCGWKSLGRIDYYTHRLGHDLGFVRIENTKFYESGTKIIEKQAEQIERLTGIIDKLMEERISEKLKVVTNK